MLSSGGRPPVPRKAGRPAGVEGPVESEPPDHERRCRAQAVDRGSPLLGAQVRGRGDDPPQAGHVAGEDDGVEVLAVDPETLVPPLDGGDRAPAIRPLMRRTATRLWRDDLAYAERRYALRSR
jgi:hypothetical protein